MLSRRPASPLLAGIAGSRDSQVPALRHAHRALFDPVPRRDRHRRDDFPSPMCRGQKFRVMADPSRDGTPLSAPRFSSCHLAARGQRTWGLLPSEDDQSTTAVRN
jgi:hypothetical protein